MNIEQDKVTINGVSYIPLSKVKECQPPKPGKRHVVVIDRGWIVAGDVEDKDGRLIITRAVHLVRWRKIGFAGCLEVSESDNMDIQAVPRGANVPSGAELARFPVADDWGMSCYKK